MKKVFSIFCLLLFTQVWATEKNFHGFPKFDERGNPTENFSSRGALLTIESIRSRYNEQEDIFLDLRIVNNGFYPLTFYLSKNYLKNFTIVVREPNGKSLPIRDIAYFKTSQDYNDPYFSQYTATNFEARSITLQPGESILRPVRLQDVVDMASTLEMTTTGLQELSVLAYFYPNPEQSPNIFLTSTNRFTLLIDKQKLHRPKPVPSFEKLTVSPLETVFLTLAAEKTETWKNFFKYISLKDFIRGYPDFAKAYMQNKEKNVVLKTFQEYLMDKDRNQLLHFKVLSEQQKKQTATVKVQALRRVQGFERQFSYTYYLTKADSFWLITGVESQLIK